MTLRPSKIFFVIFKKIYKEVHIFIYGLQSKTPSNWRKNLSTKCSEASGGWEQRTKLSERTTWNFINTTLTIRPTAITSPIKKLGSWKCHTSFIRNFAILSTVINCNERFSKESLKTNTFYNIDGPDGPEEHSSNVFSALESSVITLGLTQHLPDLLLLLLVHIPKTPIKSTLLIPNICPI